jgi:hypothetical protein
MGGGTQVRALAKNHAAERQLKFKFTPWKVALATQLKEATDVANGWLAE